MSTEKLYNVDRDMLERALLVRDLSAGSLASRQSINNVLKEKQHALRGSTVINICREINEAAPTFSPLDPYDILASGSTIPSANRDGLYAEDWPAKRPPSLDLLWFSGSERSIISELLDRAATWPKGSRARVMIEAPPRLGAKRDVVYFAKLRIPHKDDQYFVVRLGPKNDILIEVERMQEYRGIHLQSLAGHAERGETAGLIYPVDGANYLSSHRPVTLNDALEAGANVTASLRKLLQVNHGRTPPERSFDWVSKYLVGEDDRRNYLDFDRVKRRAMQLCGSNLIQRVPVSAGRSLESPWAFLEEVKQKCPLTMVKEGVAHCDMHLRNVILLGDDNAELIDYRWSGPFHYLIDVALLEASIKVFYAARWMSDEVFLALHDDLDCACLREGSSEVQRKCFELIKVIRESIGVFGKKQQVPPSLVAEYYASSYFVTLGRLSIPTCDAWKAWLSAAWFAQELRNLKWLKARR